MSRNSEVNGMAFSLALVCAVMFFVAAAIFAIAAFSALVLTVLCLIAWKDGLTIGSMTIEPHEARAFVVRGLLGTFIVPAFAAFTSALFRTEIEAQFWPYIFIGGYTLGSVGIEYHIAEERNKAEASAQYLLPPMPVSPPPAGERRASTVAPDHPCSQAQCPLLAAAQTRPFRYASWDDEEAVR